MHLGMCAEVSFRYTTSAREGLVEVILALATAGEYHPYYMRREPLLVWLLLIAASSICLGVGLIKD